MEKSNETFFMYNFLKNLEKELGIEPDIDKYEQFGTLVNEYYRKFSSQEFIELSDINKLYCWSECLFLKDIRVSKRKQFQDLFIQAMILEATSFKGILDDNTFANTRPTKDKAKEKDHFPEPKPDESVGRPLSDLPIHSPNQEKEGNEERNQEQEIEKYVHFKVERSLGLPKLLVSDEETELPIPILNFRLSEEYLSLRRRDLIHSWRSLRIMGATSSSSKLDIVETVQQFAKDGMFITPVYQRSRAEESHGLVIFIDQKGSMVPFHQLSEIVAEVALQDGRHEHAEIYYFQNVVLKQVYSRRRNNKALNLAAALSGINSQQGVALIISDAGAARGNFNDRRIETTYSFIRALTDQVSRVAWLNPMPYDRWFGSSAEAIAGFVDMFPILETESRGFSQAIKLLLGKDIQGFPV